jgi:CRP/FNR family cyclic AMP-dependent transcriptional regulator
MPHHRCHVRHLPRVFTRQEIADRIGASRERVNHMLRDLVREGFMARDAGDGLVLRKPLPRSW